MQNTEEIFDLTVIGGGPGGYPAAIRAAQNGLRVALIEKKELGGTCLNRGCIPSKALIASAETWNAIQEAKEFGIDVTQASFSYEKMVERKEDIVTSIRKSLESLLKSNKIKIFEGLGKFISPQEIKVMGKDNIILKSKKIIIATGSEPRNIQEFPFDFTQVHDSTSLLNITKLPKSIAIIGGGVIGCEFASLFSLLGVDVAIFELMDRILPMEDEGVSNALERLLKKRGIKIYTNVHVEGIDKDSNHVTVKLKNGENQNHVAEIALVAVGRKLNTEGIGLEKAGVILNENGLVKVDEKMETNIAGIYAVGDIASKWWLAHVATHQGLVAADNIAGKKTRMSYKAIPSVIFTHPEVATVGYTLKDAMDKGYKASVAAFPFQALGKSKASFHEEGFAQIVLDTDTKEILGAQVVGYEASTLIAEIGIAITNELTLESITETIHAHPTISEAWLEAASIGEGFPIHYPKRIPSKVNS